MWGAGRLGRAMSVFRVLAKEQLEGRKKEGNARLSNLFRFYHWRKTRASASGRGLNNQDLSPPAFYPALFQLDRDDDCHSESTFSIMSFPIRCHSLFLNERLTDHSTIYLSPKYPLSPSLRPPGRI